MGSTVLLQSDSDESYEVAMNRWKMWITQHKTLLLGLGSTVLMLFFLIFFMDVAVMPIYTHHGEERELPDVTERSFEDARKILESRGFTIVKEDEKFDATYPESTVIFQNPSAFSRVKRGRRIYVTLSAGEKRITVPRVIGMSERDAEFSLRHAGLQLGEVFYEYHSYHLNGVVFQQSIDPGMESVEDTPIDITVSLGREPHRFVVPDVMGKSLEDARKIILQAGLEMGSISFVIRREYIPDTVIDQSLEPGSEVNQGSAIDLVISRLEENVRP